MVGSMVRFPVHKGYFGKPAHHTGVSTLSWLLISKLLNPRPAAPGQDALSLITIYPRPDELHSLLLLLATRSPQPPSIPPFFQGFDPASAAAFSIQEHLSIRNWQCQYIIKINRITVYPFIYKRVNRYKREVGLGLFYSLFSFLLLFSSLTFPE